MNAKDIGDFAAWANVQVSGRLTTAPQTLPVHIGWQAANGERVPCQNCVTYPLTAGEHHDLRGHADAH
jgi:hypothetical protein